MWTEEDVELETLVESLPSDALPHRPGRAPDTGHAVGIVTVIRPICVPPWSRFRRLARSPRSRPRNALLTEADAELSRPLIDGFLHELAESGAGVPLLQQLAALEPGRTLPEARSVGLVFDPGQYRIWRLPVFIGGSDRKGEVAIALRRGDDGRRAEDGAAPHRDWQDSFREAVRNAPAELDAVLCRLELSLATAEALRIGQVLALPGVTVTSVQMEGPGGARMMSARLGQMAGRRAVRLEVPMPPELQPGGARMAGPSAAGAMLPTPDPAVADPMGGPGPEAAWPDPAPEPIDIADQWTDAPADPVDLPQHPAISAPDLADDDDPGSPLPEAEPAPPASGDGDDPLAQDDDDGFPAAAIPLDL